MSALKEILSDYKLFARTFLKIKNKNGDIVPFVYNAVQEKVYEIIKPIKDAGKPIRVAIVKARQEGISTMFEGILFQETAMKFNVKSTIVGHEAKASSNLFEMGKRFYDNLDQPMKPSVKLNNEKKLAFDKLQSEINVETAEGRDSLGRSGTVNKLHLTEIAFWADAKASLLAILQSVPDSPNTMIALESTSNGVGGAWYDLVMDAKDGKNDFVLIFLAWFELPEYSLEFDSDAMKRMFYESMDDEEVELLKLYNLKLEQLHWRRKAIQNKCGGDKKKFCQEYPANLMESFVATGRAVFDSSICLKNYEKYKNYQPEKFRLEYTYADRIKVIGGKKVKVSEIVGAKKIEDKNGLWSMLEEVVIEDNEFYRFAAGWDIAEGLEQGDFTSGDVLDRKNNKYVIKFHGHLAPDLVAVEQHKLQLFLKNKIYQCTEVNNHGLTVVVHAYSLRVKQYYRQNYQKGYEVDSMDLGFKTTGSVSGTGTKPMLINRLEQAIREEVFIDEDAGFWWESMRFVRNARGQMQAEGKDKDPATKSFDDRVISKALSLECDVWLPRYFVKPLVNPNSYQTQKIKTLTDFI